jgi:hypothetical protein
VRRTQFEDHGCGRLSISGNARPKTGDTGSDAAREHSHSCDRKTGRVSPLTKCIPQILHH